MYCTIENIDMSTPIPGERFYGNGKLLLSGEYFILDGAEGIALPTSLGQSLKVSYKHSYEPTLTWISYDYNGQKWFEAEFEFWHFNYIGCDEQGNPLEKDEKIAVLEGILKAVRSLNPHFLRDDVDVKVETRLGFPLDWGLGSSSTLIFNIAQWANVSPFELLFKTFGGSGYDIACAQAEGPILYSKQQGRAVWKPIEFDPEFKDNLYFVYLGHKKNSREAINYYRSLGGAVRQRVRDLSAISAQLISAKNLAEFEFALEEHENIVATTLHLKKVKEQLFMDYWGTIKSLGAWGGDFILVTSSREQGETRNYFAQRGYDVFIPYSGLIYSPSEEEVSAAEIIPPERRAREVALQ